LGRYDMKNIFFLLIILSINVAYAQQSAENKSASTDYYMMKNDHLLHFLGTGEVETVMSNATLSNGTVLTSKGEMVGKKAVKQKLENGECIDVLGMMRSCAELDSALTEKIRMKK
jgi:hypothetical protein